ncbi:MAG: hypothetical protein A2V63_09500 [Candidatus Eisenbacteria bacterium RBG_19FT_COMBO_70_11]|nr:MAG: hypothetical protein A2V63_09500 [Candidatus Eisenbacteria bacterium RBG_19FT_COMBO_70_11]
MNRSHWVTSFMLIAAVAFLGCRSDQQPSQSAGASGTGYGASTARVADLNLPSGTSIDVTLGTELSSEAASVGDAWAGVVAKPVIVDGRTLAPAGSVAGGTVTGVTPARKGDRAMLDLGLTSFTVGDRNYRVHGSTEAVIAGSPRARNLGAIAAATAAGAVVGHAIGGSDKGTIIGAVVGGGAATGVVSQTKGWQVVLKQGTPLTFTTSEAVAVRP